MKPFLPKATTNEAGNWVVQKVAGLTLERSFKRWSHQLFLVNQSVLLVSWNSVQVSRNETCMGGSKALLLGGGIYHKYDAQFCKMDIPLYISFLLLLRVEKLKCQNGIRICV